MGWVGGPPRPPAPPPPPLQAVCVCVCRCWWPQLWEMVVTFFFCFDPFVCCFSFALTAGFVSLLVDPEEMVVKFYTLEDDDLPAHTTLITRAGDSMRRP